MDRKLVSPVEATLMFFGFRKFYHLVVVDYYNQFVADDVVMVPSWWNPEKVHKKIKNYIEVRRDPNEEKVFLNRFERVF